MPTPVDFCEHEEMDKYWLGGFARPNWHKQEFEQILADMWEIPQTEGALALAPSLTAEERFLRLADEWERATGHISSVSDLVNDARYQKIIDMGWPVVPFLLADLQQNQRFWFPALAAITNVRPFDRRDAGNSLRMTEAWLQWGKRKGLI